MTTILPNTSISPLRQKLIDDMTMRHFLVATQRNYIRDVGGFASFLRRPPDTATTEDVRQLSLSAKIDTALALIHWNPWQVLTTQFGTVSGYFDTMLHFDSAIWHEPS